MRRLIAQEKPPHGVWDLKLVPGGLIDMEFIAQVAVLAGMVEGQHRVTSTREILSRLKPEFADRQTREELVAAHALFSGLTQIMRLCLAGRFEPETFRRGLPTCSPAMPACPISACSKRMSGRRRTRWRRSSRGCWARNRESSATR